MASDTPPNSLRIGEAAGRVGLSLRTVRYYEELGLVTPSDRTGGGFRLYSEEDLERLRLIKQMKPLDLTLEQMGALLELLDQLPGGDPAVLDRLEMFAAAGDERCERLRDQLANAEAFAYGLRARLADASPGRAPSRE